MGSRISSIRILLLMVCMLRMIGVVLTASFYLCDLYDVYDICVVHALNNMYTLYDAYEWYDSNCVPFVEGSEVRSQHHGAAGGSEECRALCIISVYSS